MRRWFFAVTMLTACSSSAAESPPADAATSAEVEADAVSADSSTTDVSGECPTPVAVTTLGDTCASFGPGSPCDACGLPMFGYVCSGGRPDVSGCAKVSESTVLGTATFCCAELKCVRSPQLDAQCGGKKMMQCPEDSAGKLLVEPGTGCTKSSEPPPYQWFCCP